MRSLNYIAWIKITIISFCCLIALTNSTRTVAEINNLELLAGSVFWFLAATFGIPAFFTPKNLYKPKWNDSPFLFRLDPESIESNKKRLPLVFFHFFGHWSLTFGFSVLINDLFRFGIIPLTAIRLIILGIGVLIGIHKAFKKAYNQHHGIKT